MRIVRACRRLGIESVAVYSQADRDSLVTRQADQAVCIGPPRSADSYLNQVGIVSAALATHCDAVHPGYGFLSESASFARLCREQGLLFIGPSDDVISMMGDKAAARAAAAAAGVPVLPGTEPLASLDGVDLEGIGFPMMLKAVAGGGGKGIRFVDSPQEAVSAFGVGSREAQAAFGDGRLYLERFLPEARHLEVQVVGDLAGNVIHLGERECSVQRRHQKVLEEAPAVVPEAARDRLCSLAVDLARSIGYTSVGTVEFIYDGRTDEPWFIEMNARLQVEHGVTEMVTGVDIVCQQIRIAYGEPLDYAQDDVIREGHAIQWRVTAESVADGLLPRPGTITRWRTPEQPGIRVDTHCHEGYSVPPYYDSLLAKLIAHAPTRELAIARLTSAASAFEVEGVPTTLDLCRAIAARPEFRTMAGVTTGWLDSVLGEVLAAAQADGTIGNEVSPPAPG